MKSLAPEKRLKYIDPKSKKRVLVAGDIHGDYESAKSILEKFNYKSDILIFLGDYADRGKEGVEVIQQVHRLINQYPHDIIALKGNHEDYSILCPNDGEPTIIPKFSPCDLVNEVEEKFENIHDFWCKIYKPFLEKMYLAAIIPGEVLFVHGGVSKKIKSIDSLKNPTKEIEEDVLWSDPFDGTGEKANPRGAGVLFGKDISDYICENLCFKRIIRSHEPRKAKEGPYVEHGERVITISATRVYGGKPFLLEISLDNINEAFKNLKIHIL